MYFYLTIQFIKALERKETEIKQKPSKFSPTDLEDLDKMKQILQRAQEAKLSSVGTGEILTNALAEMQALNERPFTPPGNRHALWAKEFSQRVINLVLIFFVNSNPVYS
jgi:hypothetical protein